MSAIQRAAERWGRAQAIEGDGEHAEAGAPETTRCETELPAETLVYDSISGDLVVWTPTNGGIA